MGAGCCVLTGGGSPKICHGPTLAPPLAGGAGVRSGSAAPAGRVAKKMSPIEAALDATPRAIQWASAARTHLTFLLKSRGNFSFANVHFHLDRDWDHVEDNLAKLITVFGRIIEMLRNPGKYYREGPMVKLGAVESWWADAPTGGFHTADGTFTFRPRYPETGPNCRSAILIHEGAHFCGQVDEIIHFAMEFPPPDGTAQDGSKRNYKDLLTAEAMRNASTYAAFAIHAATGQDSRFGLHKPNL